MSSREKLKKFLNCFNCDSKVLVVINADPDSIASAMAIKRLLWRKVKEVSITCFNIITRPDNLSMIEYTGADLIPMENIIKENYSSFVIVDSQPDHNENFRSFSYDAVIDHHPVSYQGSGFSDIRPEYGANSTIMTEYLKAGNIKPSSKLAAALMIGIKTDTANFTRQAGLKDIKAFHYLYQHADNNIVIKVERAALTAEDLDFLGQAIKFRKILNNRVFFHAGNISKPDELVMVADFFLTLVKVNWSIVSGIYDKKLIIVLRNDGLRKGAGVAAKEAFGLLGSAGGHKTMARAELELRLVRKEIGSIGKKRIGDWIISVIEKNAGRKID